MWLPVFLASSLFLNTPTPSPPPTAAAARAAAARAAAARALTECADKPNGKCNQNKCGDYTQKKRQKCKKTCGLCEGLPPPPPPPSKPPPGAPCEGLKDVMKKGKNKCKLVKTCSSEKITNKCKKGCSKDSCRKINSKNGTCKKKGKRFCLKSCCDAVGPKPSPPSPPLWRLFRRHPRRRRLCPRRSHPTLRRRAQRHRRRRRPRRRRPPRLRRRPRRHRRRRPHRRPHRRHRARPRRRRPCSATTSTAPFSIVARGTSRPTAMEAGITSCSATSTRPRTSF